MCVLLCVLFCFVRVSVSVRCLLILCWCCVMLLCWCVLLCLSLCVLLCCYWFVSVRVVCAFMCVLSFVSANVSDSVIGMVVVFLLFCGC